MEFVFDMKKILLVNSCLIGDDHGTGQTLASVFSSVPCENIYQLSVDFLREDEPNDRLLFVDKKYSRIRYWLAKRRKRKSSASRSTTLRSNISGASSTDIYGKIYEVLRGICDGMPVKLSKSICEYTERIRPDVIYTCGSSITVLKTASKLSKKYGIPITLHIMDNWEDTLYRSWIFSRPFSYMLKKELKRCNSLSNKNLAISKALCEKLTKEYNTPYIPLMNTVDVRNPSPICFDRTKLTFLYAGSLSINRYESLLDVARGLHSTLGANGYTFKLFVPKAQNTEDMQGIFSPYNVDMQSYIPKRELYKCYDDADVLVIAESFDRNFCKFTEYSLSTKIPEYMASGKPILAYLHESLFASAYLRSSEAAAVANGSDELSFAIERLKDMSERCRMAQNGIQYVDEHHSCEYCNNVIKEVFG